MTPVKPISRSFGSKARVASRLCALFPPGIRTWVEVFAGTASVTLAKAPHLSEHINDMDDGVVTLFRVVRDPASCARLCAAIDFTPFAETEFRLARAAALAADPDQAAPDEVERARLYLARSWMGVAGDVLKTTAFKYDRSANRQTAAMWKRLPERLERAMWRLKDVHVHKRPALWMVETFGWPADTLLFLDPPYPKATLGNKYDPTYRVQMTDADHIRLAETLRDLPARVVLTMNPGTVYDRVLTPEAGWRSRSLTVRGLRGAVKQERIFLNYDPPCGLFDRVETIGEERAA